MDKGSLIHVPVYMHDRLAKDILRDSTHLGIAYRAKRVGSLNIPLNEDGDVEVGDLVPDKTVDVEDEVIRRNTSEIILEVLDDALTFREALVLRLRYGFEDGIDHTLGEVGLILGISRERVRQIETAVFRKLRQPKYREVLQSVG